MYDAAENTPMLPSEVVRVSIFAKLVPHFKL